MLPPLPFSFWDDTKEEKITPKLEMKAAAVQAAPALVHL